MVRLAVRMLVQIHSFDLFFVFFFPIWVKALNLSDSIMLLWWMIFLSLLLLLSMQVEKPVFYWVQNSGMRLYGGAQYHRAMAEFRFVVGGIKCPPITREEIVNACGVEDIHDGTNYSRYPWFSELLRKINS